MFSCLSLAAEYGHGPEVAYGTNIPTLRDHQFLELTDPWMELYCWQYELGRVIQGTEAWRRWIWRTTT